MAFYPFPMKNAQARFAQLDPGHFHSALVLRDSLPGVDPVIHVYSPLNSLLAAHLNLIGEFNSRKANPTEWKLEIHAGPESLERMLRELPGNVVVLAGFNGSKIHKILACLEKGLHVFADKPWVIDPADFFLLEKALALAKEKNLVALDIMTERHEAVSLYQRALVSCPELCGKPINDGQPAMVLKSSHALLKMVNGLPLRRPASFFNIRDNGEGLADVGIHLADLALWVLFPNQPIDWKTEVQVDRARRWEVDLSLEEFTAITSLKEFPDSLAEWVAGGRLKFLGNNLVDFRVRGIPIHLQTAWEFHQGFGADSYSSLVRGENGDVEILQDASTGNRPELFLKPKSSLGRNPEQRLGEILRSLGLQGCVEARGEKFNLQVPQELRTGHESHFGKVTRQFLSYFSGEEKAPSWEYPVQLARYFITMEGVKKGRAAQV
ncbi:MAG: hypothetical protein EXR99_03080 [Gemmataceae bacterium]|nr:hypothetical protein [Gemmataceae bacterium]